MKKLGFYPAQTLKFFLSQIFYLFVGHFLLAIALLPYFSHYPTIHARGLIQLLFQEDVNDICQNHKNYPSTFIKSILRESWTGYNRLSYSQIIREFIAHESLLNHLLYLENLLSVSEISTKIKKIIMKLKS